MTKEPDVKVIETIVLSFDEDTAYIFVDAAMRNHPELSGLPKEIWLSLGIMDPITQVGINQK